MNTTFAQALADAFDTLNDELETLLDHITYTRPHLFLRDERAFSGLVSESWQARPWAVCNAANGGVAVAKFESAKRAEWWARLHAKVYGSTMDFDSFREAS